VLLHCLCRQSSQHVTSSCVSPLCCGWCRERHGGPDLQDVALPSAARRMSDGCACSRGITVSMGQHSVRLLPHTLLAHTRRPPGLNTPPAPVGALGLRTACDRKIIKMCLVCRFAVPHSQAPFIFAVQSMHHIHENAGDACSNPRDDPLAVPWTLPYNTHRLRRPPPASAAPKLNCGLGGT
jgi:hypothetical protein